MSVSIALIPVVGLVGLILAYVVWASLRSARIASLRAENARLTQSVLDQDASLQQTLVVGLLEGQPFGECLEAFQRNRAALFPTAMLPEPAGWGADELQEYTQQQFVQQVAEANRRLGTAFALTATSIVGLCFVCSTCLYHFQAPDSVPFLAGNNLANSPGAPVADDPFSSAPGLDPVMPDDPLNSEPDEPKKPAQDTEMPADESDVTEPGDLCNFPAIEK